MWRRLYLLLVPLRLYLALSPSYIHPDEHFQGPEIIAGEVFGWPSYRTWEFTSDQPIRSVFPLWLFYGLPLTLFKWIWEGLGYSIDTPTMPTTVFYALRLVMFVLSFVFEDWAIDELKVGLHDRSMALFFVTTSYVTWTYQTHTFSNSIETLLVLWCTVLMDRIRDYKNRTQVATCVALAFLGVLGVFNRITFPAFLVIPAIRVFPRLLHKPKKLAIIVITAAIVTLYAVALDTEFYSASGTFHLRQLRENFIFTPWNNIMYNIDTTNLAKHGLHPFWQHFTANLPQLLGPALLPIVLAGYWEPLWSHATAGITILSCFRHQEPRFLLPAVPLLLSSTMMHRIPNAFMAAWIVFNVALGILFGVYHQGGVVPVQSWIAGQTDVTTVLWWKTYSPPRWLLGNNGNITTVDLMGMSGESMVAEVSATARTRSTGRTLLVAPYSVTFLDDAVREGILQLEEAWRYQNHVGLDDLDFGDDGVMPTLQRVIGRRGLVVWEIKN